MSIDTKVVPKHIAIIMDGNGRWAQKRFLPRIAGHREGAIAVKKIVTHAATLGLRYLSLFTFSTENFSRPEGEVSYLMKLLGEYLESEYQLILDNNIHFIASGKFENLPKYTQKLISDLRAASTQNRGMVLNLSIGYSGQDEIIDTTKAIVAAALRGEIQLKDINKSLFNDYQYNPILPDIDLLIRTSGEYRISNFMLWKLAYSELYFTDKLWPDFNEKDFDQAIIEFATRVRKYGKTTDQL